MEHRPFGRDGTRGLGRRLRLLGDRRRLRRHRGDGVRPRGRPRARPRHQLLRHRRGLRHGRVRAGARAGARQPARRGDHRHQVRHELPRQAEPPRQQPRTRRRVDRQEPARTSAPTTSTCTSCTGPTATTPFEETMRALDDVVRDGKVRFVGLSNFKLDEIEACMADAPGRRRAVRLEHVRPAHAARDPAVLRGARRRLHGVRLARATACSPARSPRTTTSAAPTGGRVRATWARSRCSRALFGPETFKDNVAAVDELKDDRGAVRQEPAAARAALGDLAPGA